jgi:hypothetical protein
MQMLGRSLRNHINKVPICIYHFILKLDALVLDIVDPGSRKAVTVPSLFDLHPQFDSQGEDFLAVYDKMNSYPEHIREKSTSIQDAEAHAAEAHAAQVIQTPLVRKRRRTQEPITPNITILSVKTSRKSKRSEIQK